MASEDKKCYVCERPAKDLTAEYSPIAHEYVSYCRECLFLRAYSFPALCKASNNGKAESFPDTPNATTYHKKEYKPFKLAVEEEFPVADFPDGVPDYVYLDSKPTEPPPPLVDNTLPQPEAAPTRTARRTK